MKKILLFLLIILNLIGCVIPNVSTDKTTSSSNIITDVIDDETLVTTPENEETFDDSVTEVPSQTTPVEDGSDKVTEDNNVEEENEATKTYFALGDYGDYVSAGIGFTGHVETEYKRLSNKVLSEQNGVFQSNYEQGLLDLFDLNNEIKISIIISQTELEKLDRNNADTLSLLIDNKRNAIIDFASKVIDESFPVTKEQFNRIFKIHKEYERIIKENELTNGEVDIAIRIIKEAYEKHLKNHTFVEDVRGYDK